MSESQAELVFGVTVASLVIFTCAGIYIMVTFIKLFVSGI